MPAIVLLVALGAFGLGRLSAQQETPLAPAPEMPAQAAPAVPDVSALPPAEIGAYVASKSGSKYYLTTCSAAGRISDANKIYFKSAAAAQAAGYAPAANCPGL